MLYYMLFCSYTLVYRWIHGLLGLLDLRFSPWRREILLELWISLVVDYMVSSSRICAIAGIMI